MILLQFQDISALSNQALFYIKQYFIAAPAPEELETPWVPENIFLNVASAVSDCQCKKLETERGDKEFQLL